MPAPNIDMIAASLRSCSLTGRPTPAPPPLDQLEQTDENEVVTVDLNSETPLPHHWEQCLDMQTGEIYYINWKDGTRTAEDPRSSMAGQTRSYYSSEADDESSEEEDDDGISSSDGGDTTTCSSGVSSVSCSDDQTAATLVAAGCKACFMYFMVPKHVEGCPKCGGCLLHLGRS